MFYAYSFSLNDTINISQVKNPNEQFGCLNRNCSAKFTPKALNSSRAGHFCRLRTTPHSEGCLYVLESSKYHNTKELDKHTLYDILNSQSKNNKVSTSHSNFNERRTTNNVHTPKQLLAFCVSNPIDSVYMDDVTVGDIIIDSRNIKHNALFRGTNGIRIILGTTLRFDLSNNSIIFLVTAPTNKGGCVTLYATVYAEREQIQPVLDYILNKNKTFKKHHIAVMGEWEKVSDYKMETTITNANQIIFRF